MPLVSARIINLIQPDAEIAAAFAGVDQSILCASIVQLEGQIFFEPGDSIENHTFEWEQVSGTPVTLINPDTLTPSFVNPQISDLVFALYVDRNTPFEDSDTVEITRTPTDNAKGFPFGDDVSPIESGTPTITSGTISYPSLFPEDIKVTPSSFTNPPAGYSPLYEAEDVDDMRNFLSGRYWLMNDIDMSEFANWVPIGTAARPFAGEFQGNGYNITGLTITSASKSAGFFSHIGNGALIEEVGFTNANISGVGSSTYKGILAGSAQGPSSDDGGAVTIRNCYVEGTVASGSDQAGGLIGHTGTNVSSVFENTYADVTVTGGGTNTGGWAGNFQTECTYNDNFSNTTKTTALVGTGGDTPIAGEIDGRTTAQLNNEVNYTNWDFTNVWEIDEGNSPATLQDQDSCTIREGTCFDSMIVWSQPEIEGSTNNPYFGKGVPGDSYKTGNTIYVPKGAIVERKVGNNWQQYVRIPPMQRFFNLATNDTVRIYWRWQRIGGGVQTQNIETLYPGDFTTRDVTGATTPRIGGTSSSRGFPFGSTNVGASNLSITIQNPRKITMTEIDPSTGFPFGFDSNIPASSPSIERFVGVTTVVDGTVTEPADANRSSGFPFGKAVGAPGSNISITRSSGTSIGGG